MNELTERQLEVLQLMADGLPNTEIAAKLGISRESVKSRIKLVLSKLGARDRTEAVHLGHRAGLLK
jgi:DNA-binding NarL/FixJ family response regulator